MTLTFLLVSSFDDMEAYLVSFAALICTHRAVIESGAGVKRSNQPETDKTSAGLEQVNTLNQTTVSR